MKTKEADNEGEVEEKKRELKMRSMMVGGAMRSKRRLEKRRKIKCKEGRRRRRNRGRRKWLIGTRSRR